MLIYFPRNGTPARLGSGPKGHSTARWRVVGARGPRAAAAARVCSRLARPSAESSFDECSDRFGA